MSPLVLALGGCTALGGDPCDAQPDVCAWQAFQAAPPADVRGAVAAVSAVGDPVVRTAMVTWWIARNPAVDPTSGGTLCGLLPTDDARACSRRLTSAHLHR